MKTEESCRIYPGESIVQEELAYRLKVDKANVTRVVKRLEKSVYISKTRLLTEKRAWEISLTESGIKTRAEIELLSKQWMETLKNRYRKKTGPCLMP